MSDSDDGTLWLMLSHFALLSMMAIGGGVVMLAPDMHRYVVDAHHWISSEQFAAAYTIAQAAPGPNLLYVTLIGWQVAGWSGALVATIAVVVPPSLLTLCLMKVSKGNRVGRFGAAVRAGLAPLSVGLLAAGGWVLVQSTDTNWHSALLTVIAIAVLMRTNCNPVWLILAGALAGMLGWV